MRAFAVVFLPVVIQGPAHVVQRTEPAYVQALIAQAAMEALHAAVLHGASGLDVHQVDLAFFRPAQPAPRCELRPIVRANVLRQSALFD